MSLAFRTLFREEPLVDTTTGFSASITGAVLDFPPPTPGMHGAAKFDGTSRIEFPFAQWNQRDMAIAFWMSPEGSGEETLFRFTDGSNDIFDVRLDYTDMSMKFGYYYYTGSAYVTGEVTTEALPVTSEYWHHMMIRVSDSGGYISVHTDGELSAFPEFSGPIITQPTTLVIGEDFTGLISQLDIFAAVFSESNIQAYLDDLNEYVQYDPMHDSLYAEIYTRMDNVTGSTLTDDWQGETATVSGAPLVVESDFFDGTTWFDCNNSGYVVFDDSLLFDMSGDFVVGGWMLLHPDDDTSALDVIFGKGGTSSIQGAAVHSNADGKARFYIQGATTQGFLESITDINDGRPHFIVAGRAGSEYRLFVDGTLEDTDSTGHGSTTNTADGFSIGAHPTGTRVFDGYIKDVFCSTVFPSADKIKDMYEAGKYGVYRAEHSDGSLTGAETGFSAYSYRWQIYSANKGS